jgi:SAM-dependent methyltransferase
VSGVPSRYPRGLLRSYVRAKIATDPVYDAVFESLCGSSLPLLDIGCGVGILAFYLRERGFTPPIAGIDHDPRKIAIARQAAGGDPTMSFSVDDARAPIEIRGNVVLLDVLHYFGDDDQNQILRNAAAAGATVLIRDAIRDHSLRYRITYAQETLARSVGWLKAERLNFPTRELIQRSFDGQFHRDELPMFGHTPFNNYLFVFRRLSDGMTKE